MAKKTDIKDDTNYFSNLKYGRDEGVAQDVYVDVSDAYANYKQYVISFLHVPSNSTVYFKAYVTEYNESFNTSWTPTEVYGRTDPIQTYKSTKRSVSLTFDVPAASMGEAYENLGRVSKLVQMLYPTYITNDLGSGRIIGQAPLVRVKMMNLITKERITSADTEQGLTIRNNFDHDVSPQEFLSNYKTSPEASNGVLAAIGNVTYRSDLQKIQMFEKAPNTVLPQSLSVSLQFDVIHETTIGWDTQGNPLDESFPHKVMLYRPDAKHRIMDDQNPGDISKRIAQERDNQAKEDLKRARKSKLFGIIGGLGRGASQVGGGRNYGESDMPMYDDGKKD